MIQHVQGANAAAVCKLVGHEVHRPSMIGCVRHRQCVRLIPFQPLFGLDLLPGSGLLANHERAQVQRQFAINPVNALMSLSCIAAQYPAG